MRLEDPIVLLNLFLNFAHTKLLQTLLVLGSICHHLAVWEAVHSLPHSAAQKLWSTFRMERYPVLTPAAWGRGSENSCLFKRLKVKRGGICFHQLRDLCMCVCVRVHACVRACLCVYVCACLFRKNGKRGLEVCLNTTLL